MGNVMYMHEAEGGLEIKPGQKDLTPAVITNENSGPTTLPRRNRAHPGVRAAFTIGWEPG